MKRSRACGSLFSVATPAQVGSQMRTKIRLSAFRTFWAFFSGDRSTSLGGAHSRAVQGLVRMLSRLVGCLRKYVAPACVLPNPSPSLSPIPLGRCQGSKPSKDEDQLVPLCTLAALPTFIRTRKRPANLLARPRDPPSPRSAKAAAEAVEAEARVCETAKAHHPFVVLAWCSALLVRLGYVLGGAGRGGGVLKDLNHVVGVKTRSVVCPAWDHPSLCVYVCV